MKNMIHDGMGEMCEDCIHARFNCEYGIRDFDCAAGSGVVWDDEEECEDCECYKRRKTPEEIQAEKEAWEERFSDWREI